MRYFKSNTFINSYGKALFCIFWRLRYEIKLTTTVCANDKTSSPVYDMKYLNNL